MAFSLWYNLHTIIDVLISKCMIQRFFKCSNYHNPILALLITHLQSLGSFLAMWEARAILSHHLPRKAGYQRKELLEGVYLNKQTLSE